MTTDTAQAVETVAKEEITVETKVATSETVLDGANVEKKEEIVVETTVSAKRPAPDDEQPGSSQDKKRAKVAGAGSGSILSFFKPNPKAKVVAAAASSPVPSSDPAEGSPGPSTVTDAISDLERRTMAKEWRDALSTEFTKAYFVKLKEFVVSEYKSQTIYPIAKDVYSWSRLTKLHAVKVVVIGQDPYHGPGQAHGLSFSVKDPVPPPPSLKNIYKQVAEDIPGFTIPKSGDLTPIAKQGVLWLNTSLTVRKGQAASHAKKGWEQFTSAVLRAVLNRKNSKGVVFLAWGAHAQKVCKEIKIDTKKHLVLQSAHPSPLSAHNGFHGNGHFKKTNDWLRTTYGEGEEIDWTVLNPTE